MRWNKEGLEKQYDRIKQDAMKEGFTEDELSKPYLDKLSHQTQSKRIYRMIRLAYYLGWMRGIHHIDEGFTSMVLR